MSILSNLIGKVKSEVKSELGAIGLLNPNKLTAKELESAKSKNTILKTNLTPLVEKAGVASGIVAGIGAGIALLPTPISKGVGVALATTGGLGTAMVYGATREPEKYNQAINIVKTGSSAYGSAFASDPLKTTALTLLGGAGLFGAVTAAKPVVNYLASKAGTASALDELGLSTPMQSPIIKQSQGKANTTIDNPASTALDASGGALVPTDATTATPKRRKSRTRAKPKGINIRNNLKIYNGINIK